MPPADPTPLSAPSWATLLTGLKVEQHRITSNDLATRKQQKDGNQWQNTMLSVNIVRILCSLSMLKEGYLCGLVASILK